MAYNTTVSLQSPEIFYGQPLPSIESLSMLDPHLVSGTFATEGLSDQVYNLLQYMDIASRANSEGELAVDDFAKEILRALGYENRGIILRTRRDMPHPANAYGDPTQPAAATATDVCLFQDSSTILMVVQGSNTDVDSSDPEPQLIGKAVAAFQRNNHIRTQLGEAPLKFMNIPCILMAGTRPIFYLVRVTKELSDAVATRQYPHIRTVVEKCVVPSNSRRLIREGMESPEFRRVAFQHFVAFHALAETHWSPFMMQGI